jgi:E3 ubiquitin-protein ligase SIAH1
MESCPTCRGTLVDIRCLALEKLTDELEYPCSYQKLGCKETYPAHLIADHQAMCPCSPYNCPSVGCQWKGKYVELLEHVNDSHTEDVKQYNGNCLTVIRNFEINNPYMEICIAHNEIFVSSVIIMNDIWHFVLQCVGPKETALGFEYTVTFEKRCVARDCIKITHSSQSIKEDVNEIYTSCKCVKLPLDVVKGYAVEGDLIYFLEINKI